MSLRASSWIALVAGLVATVVLAAVYIPWHPYAGGPPATPPESAWFSAAQLTRMSAYSHVARWLSRGDLAVSVVVACVLGLTPARRVVTRWLRGWWWVRIVEAVVALSLIGRLVTLPFAVALQHHALSYGLSTQPWTGWWQDQVTGWLVGALPTALVLVTLIGCARALPRTWPLVAGGVAVLLVILGSLVYPVVVEPLFNHFTPLQDGPLRSRILALARQDGVHVDDVLVADASRRTTAINAYVDGFGPSRRVVLYDTLLRDLPRREAVSVVAHELGHAEYDDPLHGTLIGAAAVLAGAGALGLIVSRRRDGLRDASAVPALLALAAVVGVLALPVEDLMSRRIETRADVVALRTTHDRKAFDDLQVRLAVSALQDPEPPAWSQWWFGTHPTALQRIAVARRVLG